MTNKIASKFETKYCPLCHSGLRAEWSDGYNSYKYQHRYYCPTEIKALEEMNGFLDGYSTHQEISVSHYQIFMYSYSKSAEQLVILPPYLLKTELGTSETEVYGFPKTKPKYFNPYDPYGNIIMKVPIISLEDPEHLTKRIKNLVIFS